MSLCGIGADEFNSDTTLQQRFVTAMSQVDPSIAVQDVTITEATAVACTAFKAGTSLKLSTMTSVKVFFTVIIETESAVRSLSAQLPEYIQDTASGNGFPDRFTASTKVEFAGEMSCTKGGEVVNCSDAKASSDNDSTWVFGVALGATIGSVLLMLALFGLWVRKRRHDRPQTLQEKQISESAKQVEAAPLSPNNGALVEGALSSLEKINLDLNDDVILRFSDTRVDLNLEAHQNSLPVRPAAAAV